MYVCEYNLNFYFKCLKDILYSRGNILVLTKYKLSLVYNCFYIPTPATFDLDPLPHNRQTATREVA